MARSGLLIVFLSLVFTVSLNAVCVASTTGWIPVATTEPTLEGDSVIPSFANSYLTLKFVSARVYQRSNLYEWLIERNRKAVVDITLSGIVRNHDFKDTRISNPVDISARDAMIDIGWSQVIAENIPTTFSNLQFTVRFSKSADDGLNILLGTVSDLSQRTPTLQISQTTLGVISATKTIADYLFDKRLLEEKLSSTYQFSAAHPLRGGIYVCLAGEDTSSYSIYLQPPPNGGNGLTWDGIQLLWDGQSLSRVSYFVIKVSYTDKVFEQPLSALNATSKPWVSLYNRAINKIRNISSPSDVQEVNKIIHSHLDNAKTLLAEDPDYVESEKNSIHSSIENYVLGQLTLIDTFARRDVVRSAATLGRPNNATSTTARPVSVGPNPAELPAAAPASTPPTR